MPTATDESPAPLQSKEPLNGSPTRRAVLGAAGIAAVTAACVPAGGGPSTTTTAAPSTAPPATSPPATSPTTVPQPANGLTAALLVDKLTFGPEPGLAGAIDARGIWNWIDDQLDPVGRGVPDAEGRLAGYTTLTNTHRQNFDVQDSSGGWERLIGELDAATLQRAVFSDRQLYELMCDFWANHFNTWRQKTWMLFLKNRSHETVVRRHALGKFSDMLRASAHDTSMLDYLDNLPSDASQPGGVNENYARELLELHTMGIIGGVQPYTEADVRGVARIISGWSLNWTENATQFDFAFLPWQHSREAVSILGGAFSRPARSYGQGYDDGLRLIDVLAHHPSTARHIAYKLCRRFVGDAPSDALVASAAAVFTANDTAIAPTLRHIFGSAEFAQSGRKKVRRPIEHLVGCLRATAATMPTNAMTQSTERLRQAGEDMGQPIFERHSPDGYPDANPFWASSEGFLQRWSVAGRIARNRLTDPNQPDAIVVNLTALLPNPLPASVTELVRWMAANLTNAPISDIDIADLCSSCAFVGTAAASTVAGDPTKLALAMGLLLAHPTFQKR